MKRLTLLFLLKEGQILLAMKKRGFGQGLWNGVGGKQEPNEPIKKTAERECREEIGVNPVSLEAVAELCFIERGEKLQVSVYFCTEWTGEPVETEEMAPRWFDIEDIPYEQMWPDDKHWLPQVIKGKKLSGKFFFDENDNLLEWEIQETPKLLIKD